MQKLQIKEFNAFMIKWWTQCSDDWTGVWLLPIKNGQFWHIVINGDTYSGHNSEIAFISLHWSHMQYKSTVEKYFSHLIITITLKNVTVQNYHRIYKYSKITHLFW